MKKTKFKNKLTVRLVGAVIGVFLLTGVIIAAVLVLFVLGGVLHIEVPKLNPFLMLAFVIVFSWFVGSFFSVFTSRAFLRPINELTEAMNKVAEGDFTVRIENEYSEENEIGQLLSNFNKMTKELGNNETLKNDFIANVSHEFKTPLAKISGYATLLQYEGLTDEERAAYAKDIISATRQLSNLVTNILQLNKLENQEIELKKSIFSVDEQLRQAILYLEPQWSAKNLEFNIDLSRVSVKSNEELIMRIWQNIIGNAVKFSADEGVIDVLLVDSPDFVSVTIRDYGEGMDEETCKHIFDKFYQGDSSHSKEGNGLGLTFVKKICETLDCAIDVESETGKGTTFLVKIPKNSN